MPSSLCSIIENHKICNEHIYSYQFLHGIVSNGWKNDRVQSVPKGLKICSHKLSSNLKTFFFST